MSETDGKTKTEENPLDRKIKNLRRRVGSVGSEVEKINVEGRLALENTNHVPTFLGMYKALERYFTKFEQHWEDLQEAYDEKGAPGYPTKKDLDYFETIKRYYYEANTNIDRVNTPSSVAQTASHMNTSTFVSDPRAGKNLPKLNLPKFDGNLVRWPQFRDTFLSLVHNDIVLTDMQKFHYLIASVLPPASGTISHFSLEEKNYNLAWAAMLQAYDNKRMLASAYLNQIINYKPIQGKATVETLREFTAKITDSVAAFKMLKISDEADFILFHLSIKVLDSGTRDLFEMAHKDEKFPTFTALTTFVQERSTALQLCDSSYLSFEKEQPSRNTGDPARAKRGNQGNPRFVGGFSGGKPKTSLLVSDNNFCKNTKRECQSKCYICEKMHTIFNCDVFYQATANERLNLLKNWPGCKLCLLDSHSTEKCGKSWRCKFCRGRHNTMLHVSTHPSDRTNTTPNSTLLRNPPSTALVGQVEDRREILLGTVIGEILDARNHYQPVRMILDCASQNSFISQRCLNKLGLKTTDFKRKISGIGATIFDGARSKAVCTIKPANYNQPILTTEAIVVKNITSFLPAVNLPVQIRMEFAHLNLADPRFWESGPIDFLIGADLFVNVLTGPPIYVGEKLPKALPSIFGHVIIGEVGNIEETKTLTSLCTTSDLNESLRKFWEVEELTLPTPNIDPDERACETHFRNTHKRLPSGRYVVHLPFKDDVPNNFHSENSALRRFYSLENRLRRNPELNKNYVEFMDEYLELGHMQLAQAPSKYIIPHHCVEKDLKIRVVFDASAKTTHGSLNDYLHTGQKLQNDIRNVLMNFRIPKYVFVTDAVKMYRQILVNCPDRQYQHIYWRRNPSDPLQVYELTTVTYGTASAPWLALRVIRQLVEDEGHAFPLGSKAIIEDIYVDDLATGGSTISETLQLLREVIELLARGGFTLSKWSSNCPQVLEAVQVAGLHDGNSNPVSFDTTDDFVKILGLQWDPSKDCFCYRVVAPTPSFTKRHILSTIAKLWDPLGFLAPTLLLMKSFIQDLWKLRLDWDDPIPSHLAQKWQAVLEDLPTLGKIRIPRLITPSKPFQWQVIGFADGSTIGYCGSIFIRFLTADSITVHFITAKSRLAPVKTETIPRLELNAALLVSELYFSIRGFLARLPPTEMIPHFFSDSTIVLGWLSTPPHRLKTYVCNRVIKITEIIPASCWHHVSSENNASDPGSRGLEPHELENNSLWWKGPEWLSKPEKEWPSVPINEKQDLPELKAEKLSVMISTDFIDYFDKLISRFSSYHRLLRTIASLHLCIRCWKSKRDGITLQKANLRSTELLITVRDMESALQTCVKIVQLKYFFDGKEGNIEGVMKRFHKLTPFMDKNGILRAGGRLQNANLPDHSKYPIILPNRCHFTIILVDFYHTIFQHPSPVLLQAMIQHKFWIPSLRKLARSRTFMCIKCYKDKGKPIIPRMGNLPAYRVQGGRAFDHVGTDFAGPFSLKESSRRNAPITKIYLCLFVCMKTKALHLEAVTRLSTEAFLASFTRFISRRGIPSNVYSDCGTNYVGAARHLKELLQWYRSPSTQTLIHDHALKIGVRWNFIPPSSPHMGGIWEGGVKSVKRLIRVIAGETAMSYEEILTLFCKIEAQLNSRPLCPLSMDPDDLDFLSPGHFLIGRPLISLPEESVLECRENVLSRWQLVDRMSQQFWNRWRSEFLVTLRQRPKWTKSTRNLQPGELVLLKETDNQPTRWPTARVMAVHPGDDGIVRVATIRTSSATLVRPVAKLIPIRPLTQNPYPTDQN